jgi:hypothetical protein
LLRATLNGTGGKKLWQNACFCPSTEARPLEGAESWFTEDRYGQATTVAIRRVASVLARSIPANDNLCEELRKSGIEADPLPTAFNFFMNVDVRADGRLVFAPPPRTIARRGVPSAESLSNSP